MNEYQRAAQIIDNFYNSNIEKVNNIKTNSDETNLNLIKDFQKKYSAKWLKSVSKENVIRDIFALDPNPFGENSLIYLLKSEGEFSKYAHFGHVSSQYVNHFPIYRSGNSWKIGRGFANSGTVVTEKEAKELVFKLKETIADTLIELGDTIDSIEQYQYLTNEIVNKCGYNPQAWLHKYLHMLYPTAFSDFHTKDYKVKVLEIFDIKPISKANQFDLAYQIAQIFKYSNIDYYYTFACTFYAIPGFLDYAKNSDENLLEKLKKLLKGYDVLDLTPIIKKIEKDIEDMHLVGETKEALVKTRVNQGIFRDLLLNRYDHCCLCGVSNPEFLVASHIKPWAKSEDGEKLETDNGFLLCPHHDKLFDRGYISFDDNGNIMISNRLSRDECLFMNVNENMHIDLTEKNKYFLDYHRKHIFK